MQVARRDRVHWTCRASLRISAAAREYPVQSADAHAMMADHRIAMASWTESAAADRRERASVSVSASASSGADAAATPRADILVTLLAAEWHRSSTRAQTCSWAMEDGRSEDSFDCWSRLLLAVSEEHAVAAVGSIDGAAAVQHAAALEVRCRCSITGDSCRAASVNVSRKDNEIARASASCRAALRPWWSDLGRRVAFPLLTSIANPSGFRDGCSVSDHESGVVVVMGECGMQSRVMD